MTDRLHSLTVADVSSENARRFPGRTAAVCGGTKLSYPEVDARSAATARSLAAMGVAPGDRVLWLGQNCHLVLELLVACSRLGAVLCPANWRSSVEELTWLIDDAAPSVVVAQREQIGGVADELHANAGVGCPWVFTRHDGAGYEELVAAGASASPVVPVDDDELPLLMIYTGAFDGRPSGSLSSSRSLVSQAVITAMAEALSFEDVSLASGPLFHIGCWRYVMAMFLLGGTAVFVPRPDADELCRVIDAERCTHAYLFAATQEQMVAANRDGRYDLSSLRAVRGSPQWEAMVSTAASPWLERPQRYGQTEAGGIVAFGAFGPPPEGGHGRTNPLAQLRVVGPEGGEQPPGEPGEIAVRGPMVMTGYHNRQDLNARKLRDGWIHTGDIGRREADGSITFLGSGQRMLKCGLENVYPAEVEQVVAEHPKVAACAVIGVPDDKFIQAVRAVVVAAPGADPTAEEVIAFARERLAHYKAPKSVVFVAELPMASAAVDYAALDATHGGGNYPGGDTPTGR